MDFGILMVADFKEFMIVQIGTFGQSSRYLSYQNRSQGKGGHMKKCFVTNKAQKLDKEIGFIYVLFPCFLPKLCSLGCKK